MMTKYLGWIISFLIFWGPVKSQDYKLVNVISPFEGKFTTDYLGNVFQYRSGDLTRYDPSGKLTGIYSSRDFGNISNVDATNPLKILVVFDDFSKAVVLDNGLSANTTFDLSLPGLPSFRLICTSRESGFWIFDPAARQLTRLNDQLGITGAGTNLRQISDKEIEPDGLLDSGNWIVMHAKGTGFLVFDRYGTYYKTIRTEVTGDFQASNDEILFKSGEKMKIVNIKTGMERIFLLPENESSDNCRVESGRIYILHKNALNIYAF